MSEPRAVAHLAAAVHDVMGTLNFYIGPGARTATNGEEKYWRLWLALNRVEGKPCPRCDDTGIDSRYVGEKPCALFNDPAHALEALPERSKAILAFAELSDEELVTRVARAVADCEGYGDSQAEAFKQEARELLTALGLPVEQETTESEGR